MYCVTLMPQREENDLPSFISNENVRAHTDTHTHTSTLLYYFNDFNLLKHHTADDSSQSERIYHYI